MRLDLDNGLQLVALKDLKAGEFFKRKADSQKVFTKAEYRRDLAKYQCDDHSDIWGNGLQLKGKTLVFVGFTY
jgi:hypothetical protein